MLLVFPTVKTIADRMMLVTLCSAYWGAILAILAHVLS